MFVISTKDTLRVSWVWVCHNESWKKFSLGLIKDQICASVLPGHDWGAGGKIASCAHPESLAAAFWAQDFASCCCHSALWRHLYNPVVAVSSAMFHCPPSTKGGSVGHPHPQGCAQPELYELCPSPTHCPSNPLSEGLPCFPSSPLPKILLSCPCPSPVLSQGSRRAIYLFCTLQPQCYSMDSSTSPRANGSVSFSHQRSANVLLNGSGCLPCWCQDIRFT